MNRRTLQRWLQLAAPPLAAAAVLTACGTARPVRTYRGPAAAPGRTATVALPHPVEVQSFDGRKLRGANFAPLGASRVLELLPGPHLLELVYALLIDNRQRTDFEKFRSDPVYLRIDAEAGEAYAVRLREPETTPSGVPVTRQVALWVERTRDGRTVSSPAGAGDVDAFLAPPARTPGRRPAGTVEPPLRGGPAGSAADLLKAAWLRADKEDRDAFLEWIRRPAP